MPAKSPFYRFPRLYLWGLRQIHGPNFDRRYHYMANLTRPGDLVLEPGCGPAILANYLPASIHYHGFDTNQNLLDHGLKRSLDISRGNVLDSHAYRPADVVVVCDVLHHLPPPQRHTFIHLCFKNSRRLFILCEPQSANPKYDWFAPLRNWLAEWVERDGTNLVKANYFFNAGQLPRLIKEGFGVIANRVKRTSRCFGTDIVVTFFKHDQKSHAIGHHPGL